MKASTLKDRIKKRIKSDAKFKELYEKELEINAIAKMIYEERIKKGLTQEELAKRAHTTQPVIARLESGKDSRTPRIDLLGRIAHAMDKKLHISFS